MHQGRYLDLGGSLKEGMGGVGWGCTMMRFVVFSPYQLLGWSKGQGHVKIWRESRGVYSFGRETWRKKINLEDLWINNIKWILGWGGCRRNDETRRLHQPGAEWGQLADSCKKGRTCRSHNLLTSWELLALQGLCCVELHHFSQNLQTRLQKHQAEDDPL